MPSVSGKSVDWRKVWPSYLPIAALLLLALQFLAIDPVSSFLGGLLYMVFGTWVIPTAVNIILATWIVLILRIRRPLRILVGVVVSFLLGVNTKLPSLLRLDRLPAPDVAVIRPLPVNPSLAVDTRAVVAKSDIPTELPLNPPGTRLGGNEGCMCMYWMPIAWSYPYQFQDIIDKRGLSVVPGRFQFSDQLPDVAPYNRIVHFVMHFSPSQVRQDDYVDMTFEVFQGHTRVATYRQRQLPVAAKQALGPDEGLHNGHFIANVLSTLMHKGIWTTLLGDQLQPDEYSASFESFLRKALPPSAPGASSVTKFQAGMTAGVLPTKIPQPSPAPNATVRMLNITTEKDSAVDWVTVSAIPEATESTCPSRRAAANANSGANTALKEQHLAAERKNDGSFETHVLTDVDSRRIGGCQYRLRVNVKFYSKGAVVGDADVGQDVLRGSGVFEGTCISESMDHPNVKYHWPATCMRKRGNPIDEQKTERVVRSFKSNHVFDIRVELEP